MTWILFALLFVLLLFAVVFYASDWIVWRNLK
jgi:hypothetical protein